MDGDKNPVVFHCFDPGAEVGIGVRNLPHWFQPGAAMFVTYRTADSMPKEVVLRWQRELEAWLALRGLPLALADSTAGKLANRDELYKLLSGAQRREFKRLNSRLFHSSLDKCHGKCQLKRPELAKIVGDAIRFHNGKKYDLDRLVVMPNHVHVIVQFRAGSNLNVISQSWLRYTARQINSALGQSGPFWQPEPFDHIIRSAKQFEYLQRYVEENPKKANLRRGEFLYWERPM